MSFLTRYVATDEDGNVLNDETVVAALSSLEALEKDVHIMGRRVTLRIEFDPPLSPNAAHQGEATPSTQERGQSHG